MLIIAKFRLRSSNDGGFTTIHTDETFIDRFDDWCVAADAFYGGVTRRSRISSHG